MGKPRPVVIVQDNDFDAKPSITICAFTSDPTEAPLFRIRVEHNERNGSIGTIKGLFGCMVRNGRFVSPLFCAWVRACSGGRTARNFRPVAQFPIDCSVSSSCRSVALSVI